LHDAVAGEKLGLPSIGIMTTKFVTAATLMSRVLGAEGWNSYLSAYPRPFQLFVTNTYSAGMTNEFGSNILSVFPTNRIRVPARTPAYPSWPALAFFETVTNMPLLPTSNYTNSYPHFNLFIISKIPSITFRTNTFIHFTTKYCPNCNFFNFFQRHTWNNRFNT